MRIIFLLTALSLSAEDWPEWRGKGRLGVFKAEGIPDRFPESGLKITWRTPVRSSFSGPSVASGRVFVMDWQREQTNKGIERVLALDEKTGAQLWAFEWPADYTGLQSTYATGPRATPTVDDDRVYVQGAMGALHCLNTKSGKVIWSRDYVKDFGTQVPVWGMTASPLVVGNRLICLSGGANNSKVVALDKLTGKEIWRALDANTEPGYSPPVLTTSAGRQQIIQWHAGGVAALDPETGRVFWEYPWRMNVGLNVGTPITDGTRLFVSAFYNGPLMLNLADGKQIWKGKSDSEIKTDGLHSIISTPVLDGDYIYGVDSYGLFRCLNAKTGERIWESLDVTNENARWSTAMIVRYKDRYLITNDRGDLIQAKLTPQGYQEISRTHLIDPTSKSGNKRQKEFVLWSHPAYANGHIIVRNDKEIIRAVLGN